MKAQIPWLRVFVEGVVIVAFLALAGCGDDGVDVLPTANLVKDGAGGWTICRSIFGGPLTCGYTGDARNIGPGCATDVTGVIKFFDAANVQLGPSKSYAHNASTVIQSGQAFVYWATNVAESVRDATTVISPDFSWTDVAC